MIHILFAAFMLTATPEDTIPPTQEPKDTLKEGELTVPGRKLKEVEVVAPKSTSGLEDALRQSLERMGIRNPITMSTVLDKIKPGLNDYIMHPFGFKERRQAKKYVLPFRDIRSEAEAPALMTVYLQQGSVPKQASSY